ncbi:hypothetical protein J1N35_020876 [Gossypium stocksii]|uniref:Reverse transcriptase n=1 Tax=Gossypium stocksii TaxID=47602 RepID=A0A9D4A1F6_9ROSI|nr:hypothetical protein J1N35_020876 [Gossypium stocksii]
MVKEFYSQEVGENICKLPIPPNDVNDIRMWLQNPHGIYTNFSTICPRCKNRDETLLHALKECPKNCRNNRNNMVFQGKDDPAMVVWERARTLSNDFRIFNLNEPSMIPPIPECKGWEKPPNDFIKINVDAAVSIRIVGYGAIARDADGLVLAGCYGFTTKDIDVV